MTADPLASLTEAQKEALRLVHRGMSTKEIALALGIAPDSVTDRIEGARGKLSGVSRRAAARMLVETEAAPIALGGGPCPVGVSYTGLLDQSGRVVAGDGRTNEQRTPFLQAAPEPLIARLGPVARSLLMLAFAIGFLVVAALLKPMVDGIVWLAEMGGRLFS